ncbi:MAG TPA: hypothetical protein VE031_11845 [Chthoniobacterales bacterium]|nr:hypothetical protein [Chthoniobacterales bacterium]
MLAALQRNRVVREALIFLAFCGFTAVLTWPYVLHLRDAVADTGDPYLVSWILWWDYHQTFTDPLNLFHANLFYPLRYTLAFSENSYGIALPFFPLYAFGFRPLTVHAIALFLGFATSGYAAFRLGRTLTGSSGAGWIAGIAFAFVPLRFNMLSHLQYLFSMWIPLIFEALVLFARDRSRKRAIWLGIAFFMSGLTCVTWFAFSLVPLAVCAAILLTRYGIWRDRAFWWRGTAAVGLAGIALLPFLLPYQFVGKLYNFRRSVDEVKDGSARAVHWLAVEGRNRFWRGLGTNAPGRFKLFPGLLPLLLALAAWLLAAVRISPRPTNAVHEVPPTRSRWIRCLDVLALLALVLAIPAIGTGGKGTLHALTSSITAERALGLLSAAMFARFCLAYPVVLRFQNANLIDTVQSGRREDAFWIGLSLSIIGFIYSLGWNTFFYRILYEFLPIFRSIRIAARGAMFANLGLAILAGLGAKHFAELIRKRQPRLRPVVVFGLMAGLLLFELNAARLRFVRGEADPDAVTLRLRKTPMRGGVVVLPANASVNHRRILRAADHMKPLITGTSGFDSPYEGRIEFDTRSGPLHDDFIKLLEEIPTSYLVVENRAVAPERRVDYETFLARAVAGGRLRYINRFDGHDDLYAVTKTEPEAKSEAPMPFAREIREWAALIQKDPVNLLGEYRSWSQTVYRLHVASYGTMPRYADFLAEVMVVGHGVLASSLEDQHAKLEDNLRQLVDDWLQRPKFKALYGSATDAGFVDKISANAGVTLSPAERAEVIQKLRRGALTRGQTLLEMAKNDRFREREENRSLVLLHYFGYLRRDPDDPPDRNLDGFNFWLKEVESTGEMERLPRAFMDSIEYRQRTNQ